jgi:hypothetical protein
MVQFVLIGIAAGAASALLALSGIVGPSASVLLFIFAGLPIMIVAIGWSHWSALIAIATATFGLTAVVSWKIALPFAVTLGLPAWWLGYLTLLARSVGPNQELEWYPVSGLVIWAALLASAAVVLAIPFYGWDQESLHTALRAGMERSIRMRSGLPQGAPLEIPGVSDPHRVIDVLAWLAPYLSAAVGTVINLANLWLAATIVRISSRLRRPWPDIPAMRLHPYAAAFALFAFAASFLPGIIGTVTGIFATGMTVACAAFGLALVHATTRGMNARGFILGAVYAALFLFGSTFGWSILIAALVGIADAFFDFRNRLASRQKLPPVSRE